MNFYYVISKSMDLDIPDISGFLEIAEHLEVDQIDPNEIIESLSCYSDMENIHLGNEHLSLLFSRLYSKDEDLDYYINSLDSHLYLNHEEIYNLSDYLRVRSGMNESLKESAH